MILKASFIILLGTTTLVLSNPISESNNKKDSAFRAEDLFDYDFGDSDDSDSVVRSIKLKQDEPQLRFFWKIFVGKSHHTNNVVSNCFKTATEIGKGAVNEIKHVVEKAKMTFVELKEIKKNTFKIVVNEVFNGIESGLHALNKKWITELNKVQVATSQPQNEGFPHFIETTTTSQQNNGILDVSEATTINQPNKDVVSEDIEATTSYPNKDFVPNDVQTTTISQANKEVVLNDVEDDEEECEA